MNKQKILETEINMIKNENYKNNLKILINKIPDYFFEIPASSTGKYHPEFSAGKQGLLRHTRVATRIAYELLSLECYQNLFTKDETDLLIISVLMHDTLKCGKEQEKYTRFDHPLLAANLIKETKNETTFTDKEIEIITNAISSHMGQWNTNQYSDVILPKPENKYQIFVHTCDYLSSKKFLNIKFDNNNNIL
jgi:23S rRNA maturation-related 3'-5' exoribonuclease YhaM